MNLILKNTRLAVHIGKCINDSQIRRGSNNPFPVIRKADQWKLYNIYYSLRERLNETDPKLKDPQLYRKINIGLSTKGLQGSDQRHQMWVDYQSTRATAGLEMKAKLRKLSVDLDEIQKVWCNTTQYKSVEILADHFNIFKDLFGDYAYYYPVVPMNISYDYDDEWVSPVYYGNLLKPKETTCCPKVEIKSEPDDLWTLVLTNPDGNLYDNEAEVLHWLVGNIPGGKLDEGDKLVEYLRPFPPKGTGYHRYVFLLYKQKEKIDFTNYKKEAPCLALKERTFKNYEFHKEFEQVLTPAGISWFQADYDSSLTDFYHHTLKMREPTFEYEFPKPYIARPIPFPRRKPFQKYLDLHSDPKVVQKYLLLKRLKDVDCMKGDMKILKYPHVQDPLDDRQPVWLRNEAIWEREGSGKYRDLYKLDNRPKPFPEKKDRLKQPKWSVTN